MSHAVNIHVLTRTNLCINRAIHVLLIHGFAVLHINIAGPSQNLTSLICTVANVISWHQTEGIICLAAAFSKPLQVMCHYRYMKKEPAEGFSPQFSNDKMFLCNNSDQTWFYDTFTSSGPLRRCWSPHLSGSGFNISLGAEGMLMHRKSCLIPIYLHLLLTSLRLTHFVYFYTSCVRTAKILAWLHGCTGSPESLLVAYVISTIISWADSIMYYGELYKVINKYPPHLFLCISQVKQRQTSKQLAFIEEQKFAFSAFIVWWSQWVELNSINVKPVDPEIRNKNQICSPTGWLCMNVWRKSLWRTQSAIILWAGSVMLWVLITMERNGN